MPPQMPKFLNPNWTATPFILFEERCLLGVTLIQYMKGTCDIVRDWSCSPHLVPSLYNLLYKIYFTS